MTLLLLAGTGEARRIAYRLAESGIVAIASLAGATRHPAPIPIPTRIGGFGGAERFRAYLAEHQITAVLDATHPFADQITERSARICAELEMPYAQLVRPEWDPSPEDNWTFINHPHEAAAHLPADATVFLGTGRQTLPEFKNLEGRRVLARMIDPPTAPFPFEGGEFVIGRPPFSVNAEVELFTALGVTHLVAKNAGGQGGFAKIEAARMMEMPVIMLNRPTLPDVVQVTKVQAALDWVANL